MSFGKKIQMTQFNAILFDLDGTLVDTSQHILQAFNYSLSSKGLPEIDLHALARKAGVPLRECYRRFGVADDAAVDEQVRLHKEFQTRRMDLVKPFPRVVETLEKLREKGIKIGVVTSRYKAGTMEVMKYASLTPLVEAIVAGDEVKAGKPAPEAFLKCAKMLGVEPAACLAPGDGCADLKGAHAAGMKAALAAYGYGALERCAEKPDYVLERLEDVLGIV